MTGLAFAYDPDGYSVEIIKRGGMDVGDQRRIRRNVELMEQYLDGCGRAQVEAKSTSTESDSPTLS